MNVLAKGLAAITILAATTASSNAATLFADRVDWSGSTGDTAGVFDATAQTNTPERDNPGDALGAPDSIEGVDSGFLSLGIDGVAVFGFAEDFNSQGNIFEVTFSCSGPQRADGTCFFSESVDVYALNGAYVPKEGSFTEADIISDGFVFVTSIPNGLANEAGGASFVINGPFSFLALVDTSPGGSGARDGFDVDAVSVEAVPLPAPLAFLLTGIAGLGLLRRKTA